MRLVVSVMLLAAAVSSLVSCHRIADDLSEYEASCEAWCEQLFLCFPDPTDRYPNTSPDVPVCTERCVDHAPENVECFDERIAYSFCLADMSCEELTVFQTDPFDERLGGLCLDEMWEASVCE